MEIVHIMHMLLNLMNVLNIYVYMSYIFCFSVNYAINFM